MSQGSSGGAIPHPST